MVQKNEDISTSVSSIDSGAIFLPRSGQELSRNVFVVSVYAFKKNLSWRTGFRMTPKNIDFHEIFGKVVSASVLLILGGPAGGEALERASPPRGYHI